MKTHTTTPWYREPWPWILMAGPVIVIIAGIVTAWLAFSGADGLVDDDYYKQGVTINQRVQRDIEASRRGLAADIALVDEGRQVRIELKDKAGMIRPPQLDLRFSHPTRAGLDQHLALKLSSNGRYIGELDRALSGRWYVAIDDASRQWRLVGEWNFESVRGVSLLAKDVTSISGGR